ncbi:MAG: hypothetical protein KatS3mg104_2219 [Phycisphaerae bacterium]|nr:MAG: hypothetical protein KatS3mg104_2219 [Phycisphaerae bacterium]
MKWFGSLLSATVGWLCLTGSVFAQQQLNLFAWSEYVPQTVLDAFTKENRYQSEL